MNHPETSAELDAKAVETQEETLADIFQKKIHRAGVRVYALMEEPRQRATGNGSVVWLYEHMIGQAVFCNTKEGQNRGVMCRLILSTPNVDYIGYGTAAAKKRAERAFQMAVGDIQKNMDPGMDHALRGRVFTLFRETPGDKMTGLYDLERLGMKVRKLI